MTSLKELESSTAPQALGRSSAQGAKLRSEQARPPGCSRSQLGLSILLSCLVFALMVKLAWVSDDGFITARSLEQWARGHGLVTNAGHRVMAYTSPLFLLALAPSYLLFREPYNCLLGLGLVASLCLLGTAAWHYRQHPRAQLAFFGLLLGSPRFLEYSTAGLENSLSHLLVFLLYLQLLPEKPAAEPDLGSVQLGAAVQQGAAVQVGTAVVPGFRKPLSFAALSRAFFLASLLFLSRFDYAVVLLPWLVQLGLEAWSARTPASAGSEDEALAEDCAPSAACAQAKNGPPALPGKLRWALPFLLTAPILWLLFSASYYGFIWPNTAYAKLNTSLTWATKLRQGGLYLLDALQHDPLLLLASLLPCLIPLLALGELRQERPAQPGLAWLKKVRAQAFFLGGPLYVLYVLAIGGDFMSGRFLTVPFLLGALYAASWAQQRGTLSAESDLGSVQQGAAVGTRKQLLGSDLLLALGLLLSSLLIVRHLKQDALHAHGLHYVPPSGITDERAYYLGSNGLTFNLTKKQAWRSHFTIHRLKKRIAQHPEARVLEFPFIGMASYACPEGVHILEHYALSDPFLARLRIPAQAHFRPGHLLRLPSPEYQQSLATGQNLLREPCERQLFADLQELTQGPLWTLGRWRAFLRLNFGQGTCPYRAPNSPPPSR